MGSLRETFYRVLAILYRYASGVAVIDYPERLERRSVDVIVSLTDGRRVLLKIAEDVQALPRSELAELKGLGATLGLPVGLVAEKAGGVEIPDSVMVERMGMPVVNPETLEEYLRSRDGVVVYQTRDSLRVKLNVEAMKESRERLGLSLGDLAVRLGVSRKTVYQYEKGEVDPTLEKAEKLAQILGEDVISPIDPFQEPPREAPAHPPYDDRLEEMIAGDLVAAGFNVYHAKKTAVDVAAGMHARRVMVAYKHKRESISRLLDRVDNLARMSRASGSRAIVVVQGRDEEKEVEGGSPELIILRSDEVGRGRIVGNIGCEEAPDNR